MAEFLIYNTTHWMDKWTPEEVAKLDTKQMAKYNARYRKGDIVEVYPDGRCIEKPSPNSKMAIIKVPGLSFAEAKHLMEPDIKITQIPDNVEMPDGKILFLKRDIIETLLHSRHRVNIGPIIFTNKELSMTGVSFQILAEDKTFG